jgi:hypothetical protein
LAGDTPVHLRCVSHVDCVTCCGCSTYDVNSGSSLFSVEWWEQRPLPPAPTSVAPWEPHHSTLDLDREYYGEASGRPAARSVQGSEEPVARGSTVWGSKLGSDGSPRCGRRVEGQSRGTAWHVILQATSVTISSERAMNRVLYCLAERQLSPDKSQLTPAGSQLTSSECEVTPAGCQFTAEESQLTPGASQLTSGESQLVSNENEFTFPRKQPPNASRKRAFGGSPTGC